MKGVNILTDRGWWPVLTTLLGGLTLGAAIRWGILENEAEALKCMAENVNGLCSVRSGLGWSIHYQLFGYAGLLLAGAGWLPSMRGLAYPGLVAAGCGLFLYNTTYAAVAMVAALLAAIQPANSGRPALARGG